MTGKVLLAEQMARVQAASQEVEQVLAKHKVGIAVSVLLMPGQVIPQVGLSRWKVGRVIRAIC